MRPSPSIVPADRLDRDIYLVLEDFGARAGCAWRETDEAETDLETVMFKEGQPRGLGRQESVASSSAVRCAARCWTCATSAMC